MNILHHKSWHVRTKSNMERVRRDERKAAEDEQKVLDRQIQAENERRINQLRRKADERMDTAFGMRLGGAEGGGASSRKDVSISDETGHVNLFQDLEREERKNLGSGNAEHAAEAAQEKREWETKMGIQVYFADNTHDLTKKKEWYEEMPLRRMDPEILRKNRNVLPSLTTNSGNSGNSGDFGDSKKEKKEKKKKRKRRSSDDEEEDEVERKRHKKDKKKKEKKKKRKNHHHHRDNSEERRLEAEYDRERRLKIEKLRDERLKRERDEKSRQYALLHPEEVEKSRKKLEEEERKRRGGGGKRQKYNSQFNPEFFRK